MSFAVTDGLSNSRLLDAAVRITMCRIFLMIVSNSDKFLNRSPVQRRPMMFIIIVVSGKIRNKKSPAQVDFTFSASKAMQNSVSFLITDPFNGL